MPGEIRAYLGSPQSQKVTFGNVLMRCGLLFGKAAIDILERRRATHVEFRFSGRNGDQAQNGCIIVRTRDEVTGPRSGVGTGGGAVALVVELMASGITLPESAPFSSCTCGSFVRVCRYG